MAYSITGLAGMGTITDEDSTKDAGLFDQAMPMSDSADKILIDLFGASRTIVISGVFTLGQAGYSTIAEFVVALDALVSGTQSSVTYNSDTSGTHYHGLITSVNHKSDGGNPNSVNYTITFTEGSV